MQSAQIYLIVLILNYRGYKEVKDVFGPRDLSTYIYRVANRIRTIPTQYHLHGHDTQWLTSDYSRLAFLIFNYF